MRVVGDAELVGYGHQQGIGLCDGLVVSQLLDKNIRLGSIATSEDGPSPRIDESNLVLVFALVSEIPAIAIVYEGNDAAADRDPRLARMARFAPRGAVG